MTRAGAHPRPVKTAEIATAQQIPAKFLHHIEPGSTVVVRADPDGPAGPAARADTRSAVVGS